MRNKTTIQLIILLLQCSVSLSLCGQSKLFFKDGKFKVAQFTDIHWDQKSSNCEKTKTSIQAVLEAEHPDVAILTGDVVTAQPGVKGWKSIISIFEQAQIPFAVVMGNHDAEMVAKDEIYSLLGRSPFFVGERGPVNIQGMGNYVVPIYGTDGKQPAALLYCLDSNDYPVLKDYGTYDWIHFGQIEWYRTLSKYYTNKNEGNPLPSLAFFHIPLPEYKEVVGAETTLGRMEEGEVTSPDINTGLFASFLEMGDVMCTFAGHDHANDYIGMLFKKGLAYGRVSGWDAYGDFERGGRIIELREGEFAFDTWITTPKGREDTFYYPSGLSSKDEKSMKYLSAKQVQATRQGVSYTYYEGKFKHTDQIGAGKMLKEGIMKNISISEAPSKDHFAYVFKTLIKIPQKGVYRFYTYSDDGSKLLIDGQVVVDNDDSHNARLAKGKVALEAGFHELKVLYFEDYMGESLEVGISCREIPEKVIPDEMLYVPCY